MATCYTVRLVVGRLVEVKRFTILSLQGFLDPQQRYFLNLVPVILSQYCPPGRLVQRLLYPQGHCCYCQHMVSLQSFPSYFISF
jgi:hypothetical protein